MALTVKRRPRTRATGALVAIAAIASTIGMVPAAAASAGQSDLAAVRAATAAYHDLDAAQAADYVSFLDCFDLPGVGGMGQHYVQLSSLDGNVDARAPEALVYEVRDTGLRLVAVEYIVPFSAWSSAEPPALFGQPFHAHDDLGVWALHAWIWRPNPLGMFADYTPSVSLCP
jgi:hypothetical protein